MTDFPKDILDAAGKVRAAVNDCPHDAMQSEIIAHAILAERQKNQWQPIETAPDLERVLVSGWQQQSGNCAGYWWWHEDVIVDGKASEHPEATLWARITLPSFPPAPHHPGNQEA